MKTKLMIREMNVDDYGSVDELMIQLHTVHRLIDDR